MERMGDLFQMADRKSEKHVPVIEFPDKVEADEVFDVKVSIGKFHRQGAAPVVKISASRVKTGMGRATHEGEIRVEDNGLGFDEQHPCVHIEPDHRGRPT